MFGERVRGLSVGLLTLAVPLILIAAACADDGDEVPTLPADTPTADGADASPTVAGNSAIGAVEAYVIETGLDGEIFEVTDPINCLAFVEVSEEEKPFGEICINFNNSEFTETSGVIKVWAYGTEDTWDLTLELQNLSWVVTGAEATAPDADEQ
jgi:hypothetical protein